MTKINHTKLISLITQQDVRDSKKKYYNIYALPQMLAAAEGVKDEQTFMDAFTPTRSNHNIAKKLGLKLDVQRGRWVMTEGVVNEAVEGRKLIELWVQALQEGDTVRFNEYANKLLSYKVSESLAKYRELIAGEVFGAQTEIHDLVKNMNTDGNLEPEDNRPEEEDEGLPNADLATAASQDDNFKEGSESDDGLDTFRERAKSKSKKSSTGGSVGY